MARLVLFGTRQYFNRHEQNFQDDEIVELLDNNNDLQGKNWKVGLYDKHK